MKKLSLVCFVVLIGGIILNQPTLARFIERFEPQQIHSVKAVPWDVSFDVSHNEESIHEQVVTNFKPGDQKENIIQLINNNDYPVVFHLTITREGELFKNSNITLTLNELEKASSHEMMQLRQSEEQELIQTYDVEVEPHSKKWLATYLEWPLNDELASQYEGTSGKISYSAISEAVFND